MYVSVLYMYMLIYLPHVCDHVMHARDARDA